jgi:hypothetical protein
MNVYQRSPIVPMSDARGDELVEAIQHLLRKQAAWWQDIGDDPKRSRRTSKEDKAAYRAKAEALNYAADELLPEMLVVRIDGDGALYALDKLEQIRRDFALQETEQEEAAP